MTDFSTDMLLQIHAQQVESARLMGGMAADIKTLVADNVQVKRDLAKSDKEFDSRIGKLEKKDWKQTGFIAGVLVVIEPVGHFLAKKLGWL